MADVETLRIEPANAVVVAAHIDGQIVYTVAHLDPETDLIARAICERLDIDWRALSDQMERGEVDE